MSHLIHATEGFGAQNVKKLIHIHLSGNDSFWPTASWVKNFAGKVFCRHCRNAYLPSQRVDAVVVDKERDTHIDATGFECFGLQILSNALVNVVGRQLIEDTGHVGDVFDASGAKSDSHISVNSKHNSVLVRGSIESIPGLCRECGRILYSPAGKPYVLSHQIPSEPFFLSSLYAFCTPDFYESQIKPACLNRVEARELPILDKAVDGLPVSLEDLKETLRVAGRFK